MLLLLEEFIIEYAPPGCGVTQSHTLHVTETGHGELLISPHHGYAGQQMNTKLYQVIIFNLALGIRYHVDQVLRDSFTGWPFTADVTLLSLSLLFSTRWRSSGSF